MFPTQFNGHGFFIRDCIGDCTEPQEGHLFSLYKGPLIRLILTMAQVRFWDQG